jgi:hypothetical protein
VKTGISDLREHLFATLESLRDEEKPMDIARAKAIADVAQTIINSAKVEVDYINATGGTGSGFIPHEKPSAAPGQTAAPRLVKSS